MKKIILSTIVASSLVSNIAIASDYNYEITPMIGYVDTKDHVTLDNQKVAGIAVSRNLDSKYVNQLELGLLTTLSDADYENSTQDSAVRRVFVNGVKEYKIANDFNLYALAGLGCENIKNEQFNNDKGSFFNYGVGIKYAITKTLSLKLDARHMLKFDGDRNILYTFGLAIPFGAKTTSNTADTTTGKIAIQDDDKDGIANAQDKCPTTIADVRVDKNGCEIDDDKDGVANSKDLCPTTALNTKVNTKGCEILSEPEALGVLFEVNSDKIKSSDLSKFDKYVNYLKQVPTASIILEAHTDWDGDSSYNLKLSQRRANSVKAQLVDMGIDGAKIEAIGYGETKPVAKNDTAKHKKMNRRVTARIVTK